MKIPYSLIKKFLEVPYTATQIGELLTMLGFEVEDIDQVENEEVLDVKIMANRGDVLSVLGLSRELLAKKSDIIPTKNYQNLFKASSLIKISHTPIEVNLLSSSCTRYSYCVIKDLKNQPSPLHVQKLLECAGMRPVSLLVDLTNYILLEIGYPMHAFDFKKFKGQQINVREAKRGETLILLNEQTLALQPHHMVICDSENPIALAGVMGGISTQIDDHTTEILLEAAHFLPSSIRKTRKEVNLNTEASYRFERWVDPEAAVNALQRFIDLYQEWTGISPTIYGYKDLYPHSVNNRPVSLRFSRIQKLIGIAIPHQTVISMIEKLGFKVELKSDHLIATPPSWRQDILREEDLIEEVIRVYGYEHVTEQVPKTTTLQGGVLGIYHQLETVYNTLLSSGFNQVITHTLGQEHELERPNVQFIRVRTPHSPSAERLRSSLLPKICEAYLRGSEKSQSLFEIGKTFYKLEERYIEQRCLGILSTGQTTNPHWSQKNHQSVNFFTLKGVIEQIGLVLKIDLEVRVPLSPDPRFHPTRQAKVWVQNEKIGVFGQVHPDIAARQKLPLETFLAVIDLDKLLEEKVQLVQTKSLSRYPSITRDLALIVPKTVSYKTIEEVILKSKIQELEKFTLFDFYEGQGLQEGCQSLGISFVFRGKEKNLTDQEANDLRDQLLENLKPLNVFIRFE